MLAFQKLYELLDGSTPLLNLSEFQDMVGEFYLILQAWLNHIYPTISRKSEADFEAQSMARALLRNESIIAALWEDFTVENGQFKVTAPLQIFKHIFEEPLQNIDKFIELSEALCGNGRCPRGLKFYEKVLIGI